MPRRTTPPLTNAERQQRYRVKHPEKKEQLRLRMQAKRAKERQIRELTQMPHLLPQEQAMAITPEEQESINKMLLKTGGKINTGLV